MWNTRVLVVMLGWIDGVSAMWTHAQIVGMACSSAAQKLLPHCKHEDYECFCSSSTFVSVVQKCIGRETNYESKAMGSAYNKFTSQFCAVHGVEPFSENMWGDDMPNMTTNLSISQTVFDRTYTAQYNSAKDKDTASWLGIGLIFYWGGIVAFVALRQFLLRAAIRLAPKGSVMGRRGTKMRWLQKNVILPAMFGNRHMMKYQFFKGYIQITLPSRFQTSVLLGYFCLVIVFMLTPYTIMNNDPLYDTRWKQMMRYSSDRSGILATVQFPLFVLFALRNNVLIGMTGWSYATFNTYHRAIARISYALLIVHAVTKHLYRGSYPGSLAKFYYPHLYFRYGVSAIGIMSIMVGLAWMRTNFYDVFYWVHVFGALSGLVLTWYHLVGLGFQEPLYVCFAIWGADILLRLVRIVVFNYALFLPPLKGSKRQAYATMRIHVMEELIQVTINLPTRWVAYPGQYVYLHTKQWFTYGGHPFSVVGRSDDGEGLELVFRSRTGLTKRLYRKLLQKGCSVNHPVIMPVCIEGPYGVSAPVERYDEGLFFAGGIGITGVLSYIEKMALSTKQGERPKRVGLFWSVPSFSVTDPVAGRLMYLRQLAGVEIQIFCSRKPKQSMTTADIEKQTGRWVIDDDQTSPSRTTSKIDHSTSYDRSGHGGASTIGRRSREMTIRESQGHVTDYRRLSLPVTNPFADPLPTDEDAADAAEPEAELGLTSEAESRVNLSGTEDEDTKNPFGSDAETLSEEDVPYIPLSPTSREAQQQLGLRPYDRSSVRTQHYRHTQIIDTGFLDHVRRARSTSAAEQIESRLSVHHPNEFMDNLSAARDSIRDLFLESRLNVSQIIRSRLAASEGSVIVLGCGPDGMMDALCTAVVENLDLARYGAIDYYEEAFSW